MSVQSDALLERAAHTLRRSPGASLAQIAEQAGVSRTTLFSRWRTRDALLQALALDALDRIDRAAEAAGVHGPGDPIDRLRALTEALVPLGVWVGYLIDEHALRAGGEVAARMAAQDTAMAALLTEAQHAGAVRGDLSTRWLSGAYDALLVAAWEQVDAGTLAPADAAASVLAVFLDGARPRATAAS